MTVSPSCKPSPPAPKIHSMDVPFAKELILSQPVIVSLVLVAIASIAFYRATQRDFTGLPPGPKPTFRGTPIPKHPWLYYHELSKKYSTPNPSLGRGAGADSLDPDSALITVWVGFTPYIVVTTAKAAHQVM